MNCKSCRQIPLCAFISIDGIVIGNVEPRKFANWLDCFQTKRLQGLSVFKANCCLTQAFRRLELDLWDAMSGLGVIVLGHVQGMIWIVFTTAMEYYGTR